MGALSLGQGQVALQAGGCRWDRRRLPGPLRNTAELLEATRGAIARDTKW